MLSILQQLRLGSRLSPLNTRLPPRPMSSSSTPRIELHHCSWYQRLYFYWLDERGCLYSLPSLEVDRVQQRRRRQRDSSTLDSACSSSSSTSEWFDEARHTAVTLPSGPVHLKDVRFLNFFFSNLVRNSLPPDDNETKGSRCSSIRHATARLYPFVSPCGVELNFLRYERTPIVFHSALHHDATGGIRALVYAGDLQHPFDPAGVQ